ncbi:hypothetical protein ACTFIV_000861 [Dictyostelium citrinum]
MMSSEEFNTIPNYTKEEPLLIYRNKTEEFNILKNKYLNNSRNGEDLLLIKFKQAALNISTLLNTDSQEISRMVQNCCICGSKFGKIFNKRQKCLVCNTIVCSNCNNNPVPLSSLNIKLKENNSIQNNNHHQQQQQPNSVITCNVCFSSLKIIITRLDFNRLSEKSMNSDFVQFYEQMQLNILDCKKYIPTFKSLVLQIHNNASPFISKAKSLEETIAISIKELESGIRQLKQLQGSTPKQNQVINNIKHSFATYLQTSIPEFKLTSNQFNQKLLITVDTTNSMIKSNKPQLIIPNQSTGELEINQDLLNSLSLKDINEEIKNRGSSVPLGDSRSKQEVLKQLIDILNREIYNREIGNNNNKKGINYITNNGNNSGSNSGNESPIIESVNTLSSSPTPILSSIFSSFSNLLSDKKPPATQQQQQQQQPIAKQEYKPITKPSESKYSEDGQILVDGKLLSTLTLKELNDEIRIRGYAVPMEMRSKPDVYLLLKDILTDEINNKSSIVSVVPAVCPQSGCFVTITGDNLNKKSIEITVGNLNIKPFKQNIHAIMFLSPSQPNEGEVELVISDGDLALTKQFLFFTNSCFQTEDDISNVNDYALDMFQKSTTSPLLNNSSDSNKNNQNNVKNFNNVNSNDNKNNYNNSSNNSEFYSSNNNSEIKSFSRAHSRNNSYNSNNNNSLNSSPKTVSPSLRSFNSSNNQPQNDSFSILMSKEIGSTGETFDDIVVEMIHPTVSPLGGTKVSVQFKNPVKSNILKVNIDSGGGDNAKQLQNIEISNAGRKISFQTPPLPQGSYNIEFTQESKILLLENILFYDSSIPDSNNSGYSGFTNNNNNFNNNNNNNNNNINNFNNYNNLNNFNSSFNSNGFMNISNSNNYYYKEQPKIATSSRVLGGKKN